MTINLYSIPIELIEAYCCLPLSEVVPSLCSSVMRKSHNLAEKIYTLRLFSLICKNLNLRLYSRKQELISQLNNELTKSQNHYLGTKCFRDYTQYGYFLATLRIYYFFNPKALFNPKIPLPASHKITRPIDMSLIKPMKCRGSVGGTILHNAVYPYREEALSPSFVLFIMKLNKEHKLGLLEIKDSQGRTPAQLLEIKVKSPANDEIRKIFLSFLSSPPM